MNLIHSIFRRCTGEPKIKFLGQDFHKLQLEQDNADIHRQTDATECSTTPYSTDKLFIDSFAKYIVRPNSVNQHHSYAIFCISMSIFRSTLCLKKLPTFKLSVTLSNLNRFSKFSHCWKSYEICYNTHMTSPTSP